MEQRPEGGWAGRRCEGIAGGGSLSKRWLVEKKREHYYREAKRQEYRSRAVFKLKQINERFNVIKRGNVVVDLGCSPGGWCEVLRETVGDQGLVIGLDIARMRPLEKVTFIRGDIADAATRRALVDSLGGRPIDVVVSDMSPNLSGNYSIDHARSIELSQMAFDFAKQNLRKGGGFVVKVFQGEEFRSFLDEVKDEFASCRAHSPEASRARSSEIYIIGKGFHGRGKNYEKENDVMDGP